MAKPNERQKSKNDRDKSGCFVDSLDLTNSEQCNHLQLDGPCCYCCYCCYCSGSHSDGSQTCRGLVTVALSLPVLLMASRGLDILDILDVSNILDNAQLWLLLSNFRKRKLLNYHQFGRFNSLQYYVRFLWHDYSQLLHSWVEVGIKRNWHLGPGRLVLADASYSAHFVYKVPFAEIQLQRLSVLFFISSSE